MQVQVQVQKQMQTQEEFPRVLAAESVSNFGSMLSRLAIPWLAALVLDASAWQMAGLLVADVVAAALGSLLLASWVDRHGKRAVMLLADGARAALLAALALAAWQGWVGFALLLVAAAASGLLTVAFELARSAWTAQRVPVADLPRRNAQLAVAGSLSETLAFALGGWLYQGLGAAWALAVDAASYAVSACFLRGVHELPAAPAAAPEQARPSLWRDAADGLRAVAQRPALRALAGIQTLQAFAIALTGTSYTIYVSRDLAISTGPLGMIAAVGGLGAVLGASLAPRLGRRWGPGRTMTLGLALLALGAACIPAASGAGWLAIGWLLLHQLIGDAGFTVHDVHDRSLRQTAVPHALLARADAGIRSAGHLALLAGAMAGGALGTVFNARFVLWLAAAVAAAAALLAAWLLAERGPGKPQ